MKTTVHLSKQSKPYTLLTLLSDHGLVDDFNAAQKAVTVGTNTVLVSLDPYSTGSEARLVEFVFSDDAVLVPDSADALLAHSLIELILDSFETDEYVSDLLILEKGAQIREGIVEQVGSDSRNYLVANAGIEWRGLINEDWAATQVV